MNSQIPPVKSASDPARILVLGLGNTILTDDGVGIFVTRQAAERCTREDVTFAEASVGGLRMLDLITGYQRVIIVDAIQTGGQPGQCRRLRTWDLQTTMHANSSHDLPLSEVLALGRILGQPLPRDEDIVILAIEVEDVMTFGEGCTENVEASIPAASSTLLEQVLHCDADNVSGRFTAPPFPQETRTAPRRVA